MKVEGIFNLGKNYVNLKFIRINVQTISGDNNEGSESINTTAVYVAAGVVVSSVIIIVILVSIGIIVWVNMRARSEGWQTQSVECKIVSIL